MRRRGQLRQPQVIVSNVGWREVPFIGSSRIGDVPGEEQTCGFRSYQHLGRDPEIAAVLERLSTARVVTLTGPGGGGKTRLALRVAARAEPGFEDGARLVELAPLTDPTLVPASVAEALGVPERDATDPIAAIVRALAGRELLIVLDNCEHVLESAGRVVVAVAGQGPGVRILATSRERLDVPGELVFPVPPLGLPEDGSAGAVAASEAGTLFVARARAASPAFALTDGEAAAVAEVCARLDGMPLAIELAAARCLALGPAQLAARLEGHPGLLSGGAARPERHRSLEALVSWSYDLLSETEQRLLARLSVLRGGFDLEVAEQVAGGEPLAPRAIAGLLASLAGKSLVQVQAGPAVRYRLLETVRQFAADRLAASGEDAAVHARLLEWALEMARSAEAAPPGAERAGWSDQLSAGQASIRAALSWALSGGEPEAGRELAARLARWWIGTGRYSEAGQFLTAAAGIPAVPAPGIQARVLLGGAWSAYSRGDNRRAAPLAADGIACAQQAGEPQLEVWGRNLLAGVAWSAGDADRIVAELEASRVLSGQADPALGARAEVMLANAAFLAGDLAEQDRHGQLAIELARTAVGQEGLALALSAWSMCTIAGLGIQPATVAALDEAANLTAAHPDRFTEMVMRHLRARLFATMGELDAAETEVGLCWAAGQDAVRGVEVLASLAEARLAAAGTISLLPSARCAGPPTAGDVPRWSCSFPPPWPAWPAWPRAPVTSPRRRPPSARRALSWAGATRRSPPPRSATPRASWPGTAANSPTPSTWPARPPRTGTAAATGWTPATASNSSACSPPPANATPTLPACSPPPTRPAGRCNTWPPDSPPTAAPPPPPPARPGRSSATSASPSRSLPRRDTHVAARG
jgi:predicted ATPase